MNALIATSSKPMGSRQRRTNLPIPPKPSVARPSTRSITPAGSRKRIESRHRVSPTASLTDFILSSISDANAVLHVARLKHLRLDLICDEGLLSVIQCKFQAPGTSRTSRQKRSSYPIPRERIRNSLGQYVVPFSRLNVQCFRPCQEIARSCTRPDRAPDVWRCPFGVILPQRLPGFNLPAI